MNDETEYQYTLEDFHTCIHKCKTYEEFVTLMKEYRKFWRTEEFVPEGQMPITILEFQNGMRQRQTDRTIIKKINRKNLFNQNNRITFFD